MEIKKIEESPDPYNGFNPVKSIIIIVAFLVFVWFAWMIISKLHSSTGKDVADSKVNLATQSIPEKKPEITKALDDSFYRNYFKITDTKNTSEIYADKEYIEIKVVQENLSSVDISGWSLINSKGEKAFIGNSTILPTGGKVNSTSATKVKGGDTLIISSGHSPVSVSFKVNSCVGYFEQFQDFFPPIISQCPTPTRDTAYKNLEYSCQDIIRNIPNCQTNDTVLPAGTSSSCKSFIISNASYNGCVAQNRNNADFYKNEWRIFLGREHELWTDKKGPITLLDSHGNIVDTVTYGGW